MKPSASNQKRDAEQRFFRAPLNSCRRKVFRLFCQLSVSGFVPGEIAQGGWISPITGKIGWKKKFGPSA
jgi:hypothetical protein